MENTFDSFSSLDKENNTATLPWMPHILQLSWGFFFLAIAFV